MKMQSNYALYSEPSSSSELSSDLLSSSDSDSSPISGRFLDPKSGQGESSAETSFSSGEFAAAFPLTEGFLNSERRLSLGVVCASAAELDVWAVFLANKINFPLSP